MNNTVGIICEIAVLLFNILIYMELTVLKKDTKLVRAGLCAGSALILLLFFVCTYYFNMPESLSSFLCVTLPTFIMFYVAAKYKGLRFLVTFCFLDTVTLIITFFARMADILGGRVVGMISYCVVVLLMLIAYTKGKKLFKSYRELLRSVKDGWTSIAIATLAIYFLLIFSASYPKPLVERTEYLVSYAVLSVTLLTVYAVFAVSLIQKKTLSNLNEQLTSEKKWHKIAYEDALTGLKNRMAYIETINTLEREKEELESIYAIMIDIDAFKRINDTLGHHFGDKTLQQTAAYLLQSLPRENYKVFRIGGDEFAVIALNVTDREVQDKFEALSDYSTQKIGCSISVGISRVDLRNNSALEVAFEIADKRMYEQKLSKASALTL